MVSRRQVMRGGLAFGIGALASLGLSGCKPPPGGVAEATAKLPRPSYYPETYDKIVSASKSERGITVYSNMDTYNWKPIIEGFQKHYPWITNIKSTNLGSSQVFQRYSSEVAAHNPQASFLVSGSPQNWLDYVKDGQLADYNSPELGHLPEFANPKPGLYTFSADAMVFIYNKVLLESNERPDSLQGLIKMAKSEPKRFKNKITTYTTKVSFGQAIHNSVYLKEKREGADDPWQIYNDLLPFTRAEESTGPMVDKVASGEYLVGFFTSSTIVLPQIAQYGRIIDWKYAKDETPVFLRGMGIPAEAPSPNSAKLLLDYILSAEGQTNVSGGGFTPYRTGVKASPNHPTYESIKKDIGEENMVEIGYDFGTRADQDHFVKEWVSRLG